MKKSGKLIFGIIGWLIAIIIFFPIFWMTITAFKTERGAYSPDIIFMPTLESFRDVFARSNYLAFVLNSLYVSIGSTLVCFIFAIPAAYKMSFFPTLKTQSRLLWMLSTKMMPAVGVLVPIYFLFKGAGLLDNVFGLIIIYTLMNLPIAVWMSYTYFCEIPGRDSGSGSDRRSHPLARDLASVTSHDLTGTFFDRIDPDYLCLERGLLEH